MNIHGIRAIYGFELSRWFRTLVQSIASPVIATSLYFIVFGSAIGSRMVDIDGVSYGAFIVPGLIMLSVMTESISNASFGIYMPRYSGTIYEVLSAPVSFVEVLLGYVGAATTKSVLLGLIILATARAFVPFSIEHPLWMLAFLILTSLAFCLFGFIIGIWARWLGEAANCAHHDHHATHLSGRQLLLHQHAAALLAASQLFNPVVYLISGFRWSFYGIADVSVATSLGATLAFIAACLWVVAWVFRTGYRLKS